MTIGTTEPMAKLLRQRLFGTVNMALGQDAVADNGLSSAPALALGYSTEADGQHATAINAPAEAVPQGSTAIGGSLVRVPNSVGIGTSASASDVLGTGGAQQVAVGYATKSRAYRGVAVGPSAEANQTASTALGYGAVVDTENVARVAGDELIHGVVDGGTAETLENNEMRVRLDEAGSNLVFEVKDSTGTTKTGTVSLA